MSEQISSSNSDQQHKHHHHHHHHHHHRVSSKNRSKFRYYRSVWIVRKVLLPIAIIFFLFLIFVTFFPNVYKQLIDKYFHHKVMDYDMIPQSEKVSQMQQPRTIHWNECHEAVRV